MNCYQVTMTTIYFIFCLKKNNEFNKLFYNWKKYIKPLVRNPFLNNHKYILTNKKFREHIYFTNKNIGNFFKTKKKKFFEKNFCSDPLRQRMLNELFYETVPVILNQDDNNNMINSVENRSPFLSKKL